MFNLPRSGSLQQGDAGGCGDGEDGGGLPFAFCLLPFAFCLLPIPYSLFPIPL
ncbi:hypothetical protein [Roseofilum capinflatum]|uniref:Uncharacterized protein n=1 Tax=Roseofilum capinflatum BLCC-M114 TaxID=3022440 RepID=A0ABT7B7F4_9CYAN|nr:hypothetical protein [Roseofilum capinflatum]MDJ1175109.1 hypothetical protein [Roseofilum capinflatum BLCC-M114]